MVKNSIENLDQLLLLGFKQAKMAQKLQRRLKRMNADRNDFYYNYNFYQHQASDSRIAFKTKNLIMV